jgi:hypothetical protein
MDYGVKTVPDSMDSGPAVSDRMTDSVPMSIAEAMQKAQAMQSDVLGLGSVIGVPMPVPGPVSQAANSPLMEPDQDFDYDKGVEIPADEPTQDADHPGVAVQNG